MRGAITSPPNSYVCLVLDIDNFTFICACVCLSVTGVVALLFQRRSTGRATSRCPCRTQRAQQMCSSSSERNALTPCCSWRLDGRTTAWSD
jgi:hypothetical protein